MDQTLTITTQRKHLTKQEYNLIIDSDKSNATSTVDLIDSLSLLNIDDVKHQKTYVVEQKYNTNIDSGKLLSLDSKYSVDTISLSDIKSEPDADKK